MSLETGSFIADLTPTNPLSSDPAGQGDDHLRLIKTCLQGSIPNLGGILGQARRQDVAVTISSAWNTSNILCTNSATATVVLTTPPSASVTSGFYVNIEAVSAYVSIVPAGADTVNGGASFAVPPGSTGRVWYLGSGAWRANAAPAGGTSQALDNLTVRGTLSVSGAAHMNTTLSVGGAVTLGSTLSVSGAAHFNSTVSIGGAATLGSTLSVSGAATFLGLVNAKAGLSVSGSVVMTGGLVVGGIASISAAAHFNSTVSIGGAATLGSTLSVSGAATFLGLVNAKAGLSVSGTVVLATGQIAFPATQNPSSNANTLDDYEEGTFTPALALATPGNSSFVYTTQFGQYTKIGDCVNIRLRLVTSTFSVGSTGAGQLGITGLPFTVSTNSTGLGGHIQGLFSDKDTNGNTIAGSNVPAAVANLSSTDIVLLMGNQTTGNGSLYIHTIGISGSVGPNVNKDIMLSGWYK